MLLKSVVFSASVFCVRQTARFLPTPAVRLLYRRATSGLGIALCLHRVSARRRRHDPAPEMTASPRSIDRFLDIVTRAADERTPPVLMSFDDGYADAAEYVASRARKYTSVRWLYFVCPEKIEKQAGFRWDLYREGRRAGARLGRLSRFLTAAMDVATENESPELRALASRPDYQLATVEQCRKLARLPNVQLGNHSDAHFDLCTLPDDQAVYDLQRSTERFESLFQAKVEQFAFPFGGVGQVGSSHVAFLRALRNPLMWTTQGWPYAPDNRIPGSVMPRFVYMGSWSPRAMALWIAAMSLRYRAFPRDLNDAFGHPEVTMPAVPAPAELAPAAPAEATAAAQPPSTAA